MVQWLYISYSSATYIAAIIPHITHSATYMYTALLHLPDKYPGNISQYLDFSGKLGQFLEHSLSLESHVISLQCDKGADLPGVPGCLPLLCQLPDLLQMVEVLEGGGGRERGREGGREGGRESCKVTTSLLCLFGQHLNVTNKEGWFEKLYRKMGFLLHVTYRKITKFLRHINIM